MKVILLWLIIYDAAPIPDDFDVPPTVNIALTELGQELDLFGPGDESNDFASNLERLRSKYVECADYPPSWHIQRLPDDDTIKAGLELSRDHADFVEAQQDIYPRRAGEFRAWLDEATRRKEIWSRLWYARHGYFLSERREALSDLRDALGEDAFERGKWPAPIPLEYLVEVP